jgi:hypothetical protein
MLLGRAAPMTPRRLALVLVATGVLVARASSIDASGHTDASDDVRRALATLKASDTPPVEDETITCPAGMIEVEGEYCPYVEQLCMHWLDPPNALPKLRCGEFRQTPACRPKTQHEHFCIDRYEWPNRAGAIPPVSMSWLEARASCEAIGKRLCNDDEWTLACEGAEHLPYPYGYARNDKACNIDRRYIFPDPVVYDDLHTRAAEVARLLQVEPSGARESCVSPYGVHDMTGNVDEWVKNETGKCSPHCSGLKGGYWGPIRARCRPMTTFHGEGYSYYQNGFRCCADVPPR